MRRVLKKGIAIAMAAAMLVTAAPANSADAAKKKVKLAKTKVNVTVGKTVKIKIKNGKKKAKVSWSINKKGKKYVKITKKTKKGNATATVKGKKAGKATVTATYKYGKKKAVKLNCKVTVKKKKPAAKPTVAPATNAPATNAPATAAPATKAPATDKPVDNSTPKPTATPSPIPKNDAINVHKLAESDSITVDGKEDASEWENAGKSYDLLANKYSVRGTTKITKATANFMWADDAFYAIVRTDSKADKVTVFVDEDLDTTNANATPAEATMSEDGKTAEVKVALKNKPNVDKGLNIEVQINEGNATINYFDSVTDVEFDADKKEWVAKDNGIKAGKDDSVLGTANLLSSMAQATNAYFTEQGADIIKDAKLPADFEVKDEAATWEKQNTKTMSFVDTKYWTDAYKDNNSDSIYFTNVNIPDWQGNAEKVSLAEKDAEDETKFVSTRENAQGYIIWDKEYLYVLFDVNDPDISPANADHYTTDSTEFFLDEDFSAPATYTADGSSDEVQLRVDAINNVFSSNEAGTGNYELVAHATNIKKDAEGKDSGYQIEYIIKLNNEHKNGDIMGMDLQINDCYTNTVEATEEGAEPTVEAARAATLTAYDTTNNAYQDPSVFGRVKLINKAETEQPTPTPVAIATPDPSIPAFADAAGVPAPATKSAIAVDVSGSPFVVSGDALTYKGSDYVVSGGSIWFKPDTADEKEITGTALVVSGDSIVVSGDSLDVKGDAVAYKTSTAITVDGLSDDAWDAIPYYSFTASGETKGLIKIAWDNDNFYVLVRALDSSYDVTSPNSWERDGIEVFFDEDNSKESAYDKDKNKDAFQYRYTAFAADELAKLITSEITAGSDLAKEQYKDIATAYKMASDGYQVELKIPFAKKASAGQVVGFDANLFDCADGKRNAELRLFNSGDHYKDASKFANVVLYDFAKLHEGLTDTDYVPPVKDDANQSGDGDNQGNTEDTEQPAEGDVITVDLSKAVGTGYPKKAKTEVQSDGSVKIIWTGESSDYSGATFKLDEAMDLTGYTCVIDAEGPNVNINIEDATRKENVSWDAPYCVAKPQYYKSLPYEIKLDDKVITDKNDKAGNSPDYSSVGQVTIYKGTQKDAFEVTVKSIKFIKK